MPDEPARPVPGKAAVARRALVEIVRDAVLGSYGITDLAEPTLLWRVRHGLHMGSGAIRVGLQPDVRVDVWVTVAFGLPVAEVARQVDSAVRYGLERAIGRPIGPISVHVEGVAGRPFMSAPPNRPERGGSPVGGATAPDDDPARAKDAGRAPAAANGVA